MTAGETGSIRRNLSGINPPYLHPNSSDSFMEPHGHDHHQSTGHSHSHSESHQHSHSHSSAQDKDDDNKYEKTPTRINIGPLMSFKMQGTGSQANSASYTPKSFASMYSSMAATPLTPLGSPATFSAKKQKGMVGSLRKYIELLMTQKSTRNIFFYLLLNLSFMFVEVFYGYFTNSLSLISDGLHMFFDSSAIIFTLTASIVAKWEATKEFSYGFGRVEILAGFLNTTALVFAAAGILIEAFERLFGVEEGGVKESEGERLLIVSVLGLLVNMVGIFAFDHGGAGGHGDHGHGHSHSHSHSHSHGQSGSFKFGSDNPLLHGMFLHILADTLGSVGVITSSLLIKYYGWTSADPICSLFIATMILFSVWPLLKSSTLSLLQRTPEAFDGKLDYVISKVSLLNA
jgi:zinc transporter 5/7